MQNKPAKAQKRSTKRHSKRSVTSRKPAPRERRTPVTARAELTKTLFNPVVPIKQLHPNFKKLQLLPGYEPARWMLDDVFQSFDDPDGNFLEQFQTTAFDARCFELYVFAYLSRSGFAIDRTHPNPDFLASKDGVKVALEVTTVNPPTSGVLAALGKKISNLSAAELRDYIRHELPIRFGSPLFSKLEKRYWELDHCRDLPFVLVIEAFHDDDSLLLSEGALTSYLYGLDHVAHWGPGKELVIDWKEVGEFKLGPKTIPANFFELPGSENISAVVFSNSGTVTKFERMGYQSGIGHDAIDVSRMGFSYSQGQHTMDPSWFSYGLDDPPLVEHWGQGLVALHNPNALRPIPKDFFAEAAQSSIKDGQLVTEAARWHPFSSKTLIVQLGEVKAKLAELPQRTRRQAIAAISQREFQGLFGFALADNHPLTEENGWFVDDTESFLGVVTRDKVDNDWGYAVLARDQFFQFRAIHWEIDLSSRDQARAKMQTEMVRLLSLPQRIFPQEVTPKPSAR